MISRRRPHRGWYLLPIAALVMTGTAPAAPAAAAPGPPPVIRWAVAPANSKIPDGRTRFSYEGLKPGATVHDYVSITNLGDAPVTFRVYAADGITTPDGFIGVATADVKPADIGKWTRIAHGSVKIAPHSNVIEPFTIAVPANATPGDHVGGVIASITEKNTGTQVNRESRIAVAAYLRVAGRLTASLGIESVSTSYQGTANPFAGGTAVVGYTVHNTGNVALSGLQSVSLTGPFGTQATIQPKSLSELLPGDSVRVSARLPGVLPNGPLKAHLTVTPAQVPSAPRVTVPLTPAAQTVSLWAPPWPQIILLLVAVAIALGLWWWIRFNRRRLREQVAAAEARGRRAGAGPDGLAILEPIPSESVPSESVLSAPVHPDSIGEATSPVATDQD
jgi:hypothetical protein